MDTGRVAGQLEAPWTHSRTVLAGTRLAIPHLDGEEGRRTTTWCTPKFLFRGR